MTTTATGIKTRFGMIVALALTAGLAACASDDKMAAAPAPAPAAAPAPAPAMPMSHADHVKALQTALNNNGAKLVVDGRYGKKTAHAVAAYQKAHGLKATGRDDAKTSAALGVM
jgi:peptidoglycan hydrolase-like protein with peptidoglycan-binding domain